MARILLADDDTEQLKLRKMLLETAGEDVRAVETPKAAAAEMQSGWPELLILDLCIPTARAGLALIRQIRESGSATPILVMSGWPDELYETPEEKMVTRILVKPVPMPDLLASIREATSAEHPGVS